MDTPYYTVPEVAEQWRCSIRKVYSLLRTGELKGFKIGTDWRISSAAMTEYEDEKAAPPKYTPPPQRMRRPAPRPGRPVVTKLY